MSYETITREAGLVIVPLIERSRSDGDFSEKKIVVEFENKKLTLNEEDVTRTRICLIFKVSGVIGNRKRTTT